MQTEVIWKARQQEVIEEVTGLLEVDKAMTETPRWFTTCTHAMKNIIHRMTPDELIALDKQVKVLSKKGYNEQQQWK